MLSKAYTSTFNAITDTINFLVALQQAMEDLIISQEDLPQDENPFRE